ncbi:c-type heme family protein [Caminibacter sp.]
MFINNSFKNQIRITVLLSGIGLIIVFGLLYLSIKKFAITQEVSKARLLSDTVIDFRNYIATVASKLIITDKRISPFACTPAYVVNQVSKSLKRQKNFLLRQVSDRYRNKADKPTSAEMKAIEFFKEHKNAKEFWEIHSPHGNSTIYQQKHIFYAKPLYITKSCMKCHGDPKKDVPPRLYKLLVKYYGNRAFNYHIGDLRGIISIVIPYNGVINTINSIFIKIVATITLFYIIGALLFYHLTNYVESCINDILEHFEKSYKKNKFSLIDKKYKLKEFENLKNKINLSFNKINDYQNQLFDRLYHNSITKLPNRNKFFEEFKDKQEPIVIIDMDKFKDINILFGSKAGDKLIKEVAKRLIGLSKKYKFRLYHLDIDKFALVFKDDFQEGEIGKIIEKILKHLEEDYQIGENQILAKFRAGVCVTKKEYIMAELSQDKAKETRKDIVY